MDKHNYSYLEKNSHQISNKLKEKNSSKGKGRVAACNYNESANSRKRKINKEKAQALDKECKRLTVLYPFLTKNQIRSKAKEALLNANVSSKWRSIAITKKKPTLNFINDPSNYLNKSNRKHQEHGDTVSEKDSNLEQNTKTNSKSALQMFVVFLSKSESSSFKKVYDVDEDDEDDYDKDPDYKPEIENQTMPILKPSKLNHSKEPITKKTGKSCGFMDLGESAYSEVEDYATDERALSSKLKPKKKFGSRKAQAQNLSPMKLSNKTYTSSHQPKPKLSQNLVDAKRVDAHVSDDTFDKLLIDAGTPLSHVSESPDSTTPRISLEKAMDSAVNPVMKSPVIMHYSHETLHSDANAINNTPQSQTDEEIFAKSKRQRPKLFPKYSVENGYDVITLSSDSEDEVTSTVRPVPRTTRCLPMNTGQIKLEKEIKEQPKRSLLKEQPKKSLLKEQPKKSPLKELPKKSSLKEQPKKSPLANSPAMTNVQPSGANSRNTTGPEKRQVPMPRSILKHTPQQICQVFQSNGQTSRMVQTPKLVQYQTPPKLMKDVSTQMSPRRIKVRPQMIDAASEVNMEDEYHSESSGLDECDVSSLQQQLDNTMRRIEAVTPKLCSSQTQTDPHFLPTLNLETPRKRYFAWKEDRIINLAGDASVTHDDEEKQLALASKCEGDHSRFLYSVKLELELGNDVSDGVALPGSEFSYLDVTSPESVTSVQEILSSESIHVAEERDFEKKWLNIWKSPIRSRASLIHAANKSTAASSLNLKFETEKSSDFNQKLGCDSVGSTVLSLLKNSATPESSVNNTDGGNVLLNNFRLSLPLSSSQSSTETTYSPTSSVDTASFEDNSETDSEASSLPHTPLHKFANKVHTVTPALAPTGSVDPKPSLLETLLAKMRSFSTGSSIKQKPESSPLTSGLFTWSPFTLQKNNVSEPPQKKLKVASPRTLLQESSTFSSKQIFQNQDGKSPKSPTNAAKKAYENKLLAKGDHSRKESPPQIQDSSAQNENDKMTEQANTCAKSPTSRKDDLLCDLFDVATPKSAGGTVNRFIGYSRELHPHLFFDEDCSDAFG